jgi:hypothetical protein
MGPRQARPNGRLPRNPPAADDRGLRVPRYPKGVPIPGSRRILPEQGEAGRPAPRQEAVSIRFQARPLLEQPHCFRLAGGAATGHGAGATAPVAGDAPTALSFDHLVGAYQQPGRKFDPKRFGRVNAPEPALGSPLMRPRARWPGIAPLICKREPYDFSSASWNGRQRRRARSPERSCACW